MGGVGGIKGVAGRLAIGALLDPVTVLAAVLGSEQGAPCFALYGKSKAVSSLVVLSPRELTVLRTAF